MSEALPNITLRPARPDDAPQAAPLIYSAGPALFNAVFGPPEPAILRFFTALFRLSRNPFSFENALLAEQGGRVVGLALSADAAERRRIGRRLFWLAPCLRGPLALLRAFPNAWGIMACTSSPPPGAFYLSILAVAPDARRQGIGSLLLVEIRRRAQAAGSPALVLHTELDNLTAQRLYQRHGYIETYRKEAKNAARTGVQGFVMMELTLAPTPPSSGTPPPSALRARQCVEGRGASDYGSGSSWHSAEQAMIVAPGLSPRLRGERWRSRIGGLPGTIIPCPARPAPSAATSTFRSVSASAPTATSIPFPATPAAASSDTSTR